MFSKADIRQMVAALGDPIVWLPGVGRPRQIQGIIERQAMDTESQDGAVMVAGQDAILHVSEEQVPNLKDGDKFRDPAGITYEGTPLDPDGSGFREISLLKV